jgi:general stress protein 26
VPSSGALGLFGLLTRQEFIAFVRTAQMAVVATTNAQGQPQAALVEVAVTDAGELVFDTRIDTRKVTNIERESRVAVVIGWREEISIQVEGVAEILTGTARIEFGHVFESQFSGSRVLDDDFAVIRIVPDWLRYYDARPGSFEVSEGIWSE